MKNLLAPAVWALLLKLSAVVPAVAQLKVDNNPPNNAPHALVKDVLVDEGVTVKNITFQGDSTLQSAFFDGSDSNIGMDSGVLFSTGDVNNAEGPNDDDGDADGVMTGGSGDPDLDQLSGAQTQDAAVLEFDFVPTGDTIKFNYVFASEEYPEWVCTRFNDVFGFFLSGPGINGPYSNNAINIAEVPVVDTNVAINTINEGEGANVDPLNEDPQCRAGCPCNDPFHIANGNGNGTDPKAVEYDGFTVSLTAVSEVSCDSTYHIKIALADVDDGLYDSGVFLEANSFYSPPVTVDLGTVSDDSTVVEGCEEATLTFSRKRTDTAEAIPFTIGGNAINGTDYKELPDSVYFDKGEDTATLVLDPFADDTVEGVDTATISVNNISKCGDTIPETATVFIEDQNNIAVNAEDDSICFGDSIRIGAQASGGDKPYDYQWSNGMSGDSIKVSPFQTDTLVVDVSDLHGCVGTDTMVVKVEGADITAVPDTSLCMGDSVQLQASGGDSYDWTPSAGLSKDSIADPIAGPDSSRTYTVVGTDSTKKCDGADSVRIVVSSAPVADAGEDSTVCAGEAIQLGGTPTGPQGSSYAWSPANELDDSTKANPIAKPGDTTEFIVWVTDSNGCLASDSVRLETRPSPDVTAVPDTSICPGDSVQLQASGGNDLGWSPSDSLTNDSIADPIAFPADSTEYIVSIDSTNGCKGRDTATVNVPPLEADAGPDQWLCPGDSGQLSASGGTDYVWSPSKGLSDTAVADPKVALSDSIQYQVMVTNALGCADEDSIKVFVNSAIPTRAGKDDTICKGDTALLGGSPTAPQGTDYTWRPGSGLSDSTVANPEASPSTTTTYILETSTDTCTNKDTITIVVDSLPKADAGKDTSFCSGDTIILNASGGSEYSWEPSMGLSDTSVANPKAFPGDTTTYRVMVTDSNGCSARDSITLDHLSLPTAEAGPGRSICKGDSTTLNASGGVSYQWEPGMSLTDDTLASPIAFPDDTTTYRVTVTNSSGCSAADSLTVAVRSLPDATASPDTTICVGDSVQLMADGGSDYVWSPAAGLSSPAVKNPKASPSDTTLYVVKVTGPTGCTARDSVMVRAAPGPDLNAGNDRAICRGDSVQLNVSDGKGHTWTPATGLDDPDIPDPTASPQDTTQYFVKAEGDLGCTSKDSVTVLVDPLPDADAGNDRTVCEFDTVQLNASGGSVYSWSPSSFLSDPDIEDPLAFPSGPVTYKVEVIDSNGCKAQDSVSLDVFTIQAGPDTTLCKGESVGLYTKPGAAPSYNWSPGDGLNDSTLATPIAAPDSTTIYQVVATGTTGCKDTAVVNVEIKETAEARYTVDTIPTCSGAELRFQATGGSSGDFMWVLPGGDTVRGPTLDHMVPADDSDRVELIGSGAVGCSDTAVWSGSPGIPDKLFDIRMPNVFTPNGDGDNDQLVLGKDKDLSECAKLKVFNRWGQKMFVSGQGDLVWDGRTPVGKKAPEGTYFYTVVIKDRKYNGKVTLLR